MAAFLVFGSVMMDESNQRRPGDWFDAAEDAFRDEWTRMARLGRALSEIGAPDAPDALARAALQDGNLRAFQDMTAQVGAQALDGVRNLLPRLEEKLTESEEGAASADSLVADLDAALQAARHARDAEMDALIARLRKSAPE